MKINEKNLSAYSITTTHIDKEGYLQKRGEVNKNFQRRYFILKGNLLFYFEKKGDKEPIGVIILEGCTIELAHCEDQFTFKIVFNGGSGRSYVLATDSQQSLEAWMKALARASYDYLKLMVAELQKQLDELNENDDSSSLTSLNDSNKGPPKRQNPFNKPENMGIQNECSSRQRANTFTYQSENDQQLPSQRHSSGNLPSRPAPPPPGGGQRISFPQLHEEYGVQIMKDWNNYFTQKNKKTLKIRSDDLNQEQVLVDIDGDCLSVEITEKKCDITQQPFEQLIDLSPKTFLETHLD